MKAAPLLALVAGSASAWVVPGAGWAAEVERARCATPSAQFGFKVQKSERLLIREAWERADAYRPGKPNWFTTKQKSLVELHESLLPVYESSPTLPPPTNATSLLGSLLKVLTTGDLALTLCSKEPPVLTKLRDWLVEELPMSQAVLGLPEEQGRVLSVLVKALDARKILDLGTFTGYSSIAMALAAADDSKVICCEPQQWPARAARNWWLKAGVSSKCEMHEVKAEALLQQMLDGGEHGTVDMVFCDPGNRGAYTGLHEQLMQLVRVGGVVVYYDTLWAADEINSHGHFPKMRAFNEKLANDPRVLATLVPLSYGITIAIKTMELDGEALASAREAQADGDDRALRELLAERRKQVEARLAEMPPPPTA